MQPRVQLGSVPTAVQALTVPDGSVTGTKLADDSVTAEKIADGSISGNKLDITDGLSVDAPMSVAGDITMGGVLTGTTSYWADYRSYLRFFKEDGVVDSQLCPEGGTAIGVVAPKQSLELLTGADICAKSFHQNNILHQCTSSCTLWVHQRQSLSL